MSMERGATLSSERSQATTTERESGGRAWCSITNRWKRRMMEAVGRRYFGIRQRSCLT